MALISKPNTFTAGQTIVASEHNNNFDTIYNDYNGNITNANISGTAAIVDTKLAQLTTANKVAVSAVEEGDLSLTGVILPEQASAPTTAASEGALYTKDSGTQPELFYREESDGDEIQITSGGAIKPSVIGQEVITMDQGASTITVTKGIPNDNTSPLYDEGGKYSSLDTAFTATNASSTLIVEVTVQAVAEPGNGGNIGVSLFKDAATTEPCVAFSMAGHGDNASTATAQNVKLVYTASAGDTSAHTWQVNVGRGSGTSNVPVNQNPGADTYNNTMTSTVKITEILP